MNKGYVEAHWFERYVWSIYFAVTTMTTVGYGDITPANVYEAGLLIFGMVMSCFTFAVTFNTIGDILSDITKDAKEYKRSILLVNRYMQKKNSSQELKFKVQKYLENKF